MMAIRWSSNNIRNHDRITPMIPNTSLTSKNLSPSIREFVLAKLVIIESFDLSYRKPSYLSYPGQFICIWIISKCFSNIKNLFAIKKNKK